MNVCHVLADVSTDEVRLERITRMGIVLENLGYKVEIYGRDLCDETRASNLETQLGLTNGWQTDFADRIHAKLKGQLSVGDLIIATEAWHSYCFKGILDFHRGKYATPACAIPVVELWIDYNDSFAWYRVFATRYAMYSKASSEDRLRWVPDWITAVPYYNASVTPEALISCKEHTSDPFSLIHLEDSRKGVPICAPDWGAWHETVCHGVSGMLYRTDEGRRKALDKATDLSAESIAGWVHTTFSLQKASDQLNGYLRRICHA